MVCFLARCRPPLQIVVILPEHYFFWAFFHRKFSMEIVFYVKSPIAVFVVFHRFFV
jgi:hypothetical protein